jgi:CTP:molybdopterin cytidylyltransferase MocA
LIEYQGTALVRRAAVAALGAGCLPVVVVVGAEADKVLAAIKDLSGITPCPNHAWQTGLASSLKAGVKCARALVDMDAILVTVADQPNVTAEVLGRLRNAYAQGNRIVAASYDGIVGVPAIFGSEYFDELDQLEGDKGAGSWLRARQKGVCAVEVTEAAADIDTPADIERFISGNTQ